MATPALGIAKRVKQTDRTPHNSKPNRPLYITQVQIPIFMPNRKILSYVTKEIIAGVFN